MIVRAIVLALPAWLGVDRLKVPGDCRLAFAARRCGQRMSGGTDEGRQCRGEIRLCVLCLGERR
jgi:hypothetical protein